MKRILAATLCALVLLTGCSAPAAPEAEAPVQIPNPIHPVENAAALAALGLPVEAPQEASEAYYATIDGTPEIAQAQFDAEGLSYTYRAAKTTEDISGVYETFDDEERAINVNYADWSVSMRLRTEADGTGMLALWTHGDVQFCLYCADATDIDVFRTLALQLAEASFRALA